MPKYNNKVYKFISANQINSSSLGPNIQETQLYDKVTKVQQQIHSKLFQAKKYRANYNCQHTNVFIDKISQQKICNIQDQNQRNQIFTQQANNIIGKYDILVNYYDKFWKLFLLNEMTKKKIDDLHQSIIKINDISSDVSKYFHQRQYLFRNSFYKGIKKQKRKSFQSEQYSYQETHKNICPFPECQKHYDSEASLNLHMKSKHNAGKKSERQQQAEIYWKYLDQKKSSPEIQIQFPPGYLEQYGYLTGRIDRKNYQHQKNLYGWIQGQLDKKKYFLLKKQVLPQSLNTSLNFINNQ